MRPAAITNNPKVAIVQAICDLSQRFNTVEMCLKAVFVEELLFSTKVLFVFDTQGIDIRSIS